MVTGLIVVIILLIHANVKSLGSTPNTNIILYIYYISIKKKEKKQWLQFSESDENHKSTDSGSLSGINTK